MGERIEGRKWESIGSERVGRWLEGLARFLTTVSGPQGGGFVPVDNGSVVPWAEFDAATHPPVPEGYEAAGEWRSGDGSAGLRFDAVLREDGEVFHLLSGVGYIQSRGYWRPLRKVPPKPNDDYILDGWERSSEWVRNKADLRSLRDDEAYQADGGWVCIVRKAESEPADPIDAMSDAEAIAEAERAAGCEWSFDGTACLLTPTEESGDAYAIVRTAAWSIYAEGGGSVTAQWEGDGAREKAAASRALLRHWRDNPEDKPAPKAKGHHSEDIEAAYRALHDAGIPDAVSLAEGVAELVARFDRLFEMEAEARRALMGCLLDVSWETLAEGVGELVAERDGLLRERGAVTSRLLAESNEARRLMTEAQDERDALQAKLNTIASALGGE